MTDAERDALRDYIVALVTKKINTLRDELEGVIAKIGEEIKNTNKQLNGATRYKGAWQPAAEYSRGDTATRSGALWHCNSIEQTTEAPGGGPSWTMMHKSTHHGEVR